MSSRVVGRSSATTVRKNRPESGKLQRRPKSDTTAKKTRPQKKESDEKEGSITASQIVRSYYQLPRSILNCARKFSELEI